VGVGSEGLPTRDEVLGGLDARRGQTLLFLIEARTARLAALSNRARELRVGERASAEREQVFLEAFALGRELRQRPSVQDLERYAPQWADLVPETPRMRAAVAHLLGRRHGAPYRLLPRTRVALGLDDSAVRTAFERQFGYAPEQDFRARLTPLDRLAWWRSTAARSLEELPPFWSAFALTLTETIGAGILALPIAVAGIGPLAGVAILVALGLVNMLTIACIAEATARDGSARFGATFAGRIVGGYLGGSASVAHGVATAVFALACLHVYYLGFATALSDATRLPAPGLVAVLFLTGLIYLRRGSMGATVASAILVSGINLVLLIVLALLALGHLRVENLLYSNLPFVSGRPFEASGLVFVFGVVMTAYYGHLSVSNGAQFVLRRDPSARSLIWGSAAAQGTAIVVYSLWVMAVNGAIAPADLAGERGTALGPLAARVGPAVLVLGSLFAVLGMGMASIHFSLAVFNLVRERLPGQMRGRFVLAVSPVALTFLATEWLVMAGAESFSRPLAVIGVIVVSLLAGALPVMLLASSRRKGDRVPSGTLGSVAHPFVLAAVYVLSVGSMFVHGLVIWDAPLERAAALAAGIATLGLTASVAWRGGFTPRVIAEVQRRDSSSGDSGSFGLTAIGRAFPAAVRLVYRQGEQHSTTEEGEIPALRSLSSVVFELPATRASELKVWVHGVSSDGYSEAWPATVELADAAGASRVLEPMPGDGQRLTAIDGAPIRVTVSFPAQGAR
jgi:amino acid permease